MLDKQLLAYIKGKKKWIVWVVVFNILGLSATLGMTSMFIHSISEFVQYKMFSGMMDLIVALACVAVKVITSFFQARYSTKLADEVVLKLREDTFQKFLWLNGKTPFSSQEMAQLSTEGIEQLRLYYSFYLPSFFYAMLAPVLLFVVFSFLDGWVALLYLACVPLIPMSIVLVSKWAKRIFSKYWNQYTSLGDGFLDNVRGMQELKIFSYDATRQKEMMKESEGFRKITMKVLTMQLASVTIMDLVAFGGAGIGIVLSLQAMQKGLSVEATLFMILIGAEFFLPMRALGSAFHIAMNGATAGKKVMTLLAELEEEEGKKEIDGITSVSLKNVTFSYDERPIVENVEIDLRKGCASIVGLSGSGKSTIAKLCMRMEKNQQGKIFLNEDIELDAVSRKSFYEKACYISNNTYLFHTSIREGFQFYNPSITEEQMYELLQTVCLQEFIQSNGGLDFKINESATNVSGGEKQRLILAFYLSKSYDFYVFDEATSNIDVESEDIILKVIQELAKNHVVLLITHRLKNVLSSNYVYYVEDCKIVEQGTVVKLLNQKTRFYELLHQQTRLEVFSSEA